MFYTYLHRRADDLKPFYIGKGSGRRAWKADKRSAEWMQTKAKHGLLVEIVAHWPTEAEALTHERFLIACFRDMGYSLCNKNSGGAGNFGFTMPESARIRQSAAKVGERNPFFGKHHGEETRRLLSEKFSGRKLSQDHIAKVSAALKAKYAAEPFHRIGKKHPDAVKEKIRASGKLGNQYRGKPVKCVETGRVFSSSGAAADWLRECGIANPRPGAIRECSAGKRGRETIYGYHWVRV